MDPSKVADLPMKAFIAAVEDKPELLEQPDLSFFKKYLLSLGAKLPEPKKKEAHSHDHSHAEKKEHSHGHKHDGCCGHDHGQEHGHEHGHEEPSHGHEHDHEEEEDDEPDDPDPDLWTPDNDPPAAMGPESAGELSDAQMEAASESKMAAAEAASNGDFATAADKYTAALKLM